MIILSICYFEVCINIASRLFSDLLIKADQPMAEQKREWGWTCANQEERNRGKMRGFTRGRGLERHY